VTRHSLAEESGTTIAAAYLPFARKRSI
jgi:hypothetical protein